MIVDELVTILGIDIATEALPNVTKFNSKLDDVVRYCNRVATAAVVTGAAIVAFVEKMSHSAAGIATFSHYTGMSTDAIQQWTYAVQQAGGEAGGLKNDIVSLEKSLNPLMPGRYNEGLFMMFGSGYKNIKSADQALMMISERMQGMSKQRQLQWGDALGLGPDTMLLLQQGPAKIKRYLSEIKGSLITPEQTERAFRFMQVWNKLKTEMYKTGENIVTLLLPGIQKALTWFDRWLNVNQRWISSGIDRFVKGVSEGFERFGSGLGELKKHVPMVGKLFDILLDPKVIGGTVMVALTGIATVLGIIAAKYALIGAAVLTVIGALEDFSTGIGKDEEGVYRSTGKDTLFGRAADWVNDHILAHVGLKDEKHKYAGSVPGKSMAVDMLPKFKELFDVATGKNVPVDNNYRINREYLERRQTEPAQSTINNTVNNTVNVTAPDAYQAGSETVYQLKRMTGADFTGRTVGGNGQ